MDRIWTSQYFLDSWVEEESQAYPQFQTGKRKTDTASVPETHSSHLLPYNLERRNQFWCMTRLQIFWVVPETWIKQQHISASQWNSKSTSVGTNTTDRCLTHIQDAAHSERIVVSVEYEYACIEYIYSIGEVKVYMLYICIHIHIYI